VSIEISVESLRDRATRVVWVRVGLQASTIPITPSTSQGGRPPHTCPGSSIGLLDSRLIGLQTHVQFEKLLGDRYEHPRITVLIAEAFSFNAHQVLSEFAR